MGAGALVQISAEGTENVGLTIGATKTFWKSRYQKHTMFAIQPHELSFNPGTVGFGKRAKIHLLRSGDLIGDLWLVFTLARLNNGNPDARWTNDIGRAIIDEMTIEIGNVTYDTKEGVFLHAYEKLASIQEQATGQLTGDTTVEAELELWAQTDQLIYVPITFWFTDYNGRALPVIALFQQDVNLYVKLRPQIDVIREVSAPVGSYDPTTETNGLISNMYVLCEYVYLGAAERNWFAAGGHRYLFCETQKGNVINVPVGTSLLRVSLTFDHPIVEFIWFFRKFANGPQGEKAYMDWTGEEVAPFLTESFSSMRLFLNGNERFTARDPLYFRKVVPKSTHTRTPSKNVYVYDLALDPEGENPSGSLNLSRIDNSQMNFTFTTPLTERYELHVFARSLNWLTIDRGMAKKHFS